MEMIGDTYSDNKEEATVCHPCDNIPRTLEEQT